LTIKQILGLARETLAANDIEDFSLESEILLRHILGMDRAQFYLELDRKPSSQQKRIFWQLIRRRLNHEPTAYITGQREFYGLDFYVSPDVLIPRPESELLVEKALELAQNHDAPSIADIGTGCGAIAVSLAISLPQATVFATDISEAALEVARLNCQRHGMADRVLLMRGDMLEPLPQPVDIIVANLPYVRQPELAKVNTRDHEPALALDGGRDGLEKIRRLCRQAGDKLRPKGCLLLEVGLGQGGEVVSLLHSLFPSAGIQVTPDLSGIDRIVSLNLS
jgi:release factor glutamine methyltransferase